MMTARILLPDQIALYFILEKDAILCIINDACTHHCSLPCLKGELIYWYQVCLFLNSHWFILLYQAHYLCCTLFRLYCYWNRWLITCVSRNRKKRDNSYQNGENRQRSICIGILFLLVLTLFFFKCNCRLDKVRIFIKNAWFWFLLFTWQCFNHEALQYTTVVRLHTLFCRVSINLEIIALD